MALCNIDAALFNLAVHRPNTETGIQNRARRWAPRSPRCRFRNGQRAAVLRALTGARLYLNGEVPTLEAAAACCGSGVVYVRAAVVLVKTENSTMLMDVLAGTVPLLAAAKQLKHIAKLVDDYRRANAAELITFGKTVGVGDVWDHVINPAL
jgi:hypothetical protein